MQIPVRLVLGDHENEGRAAIVYGPLVLALDTALNSGVTNPARAELSSIDSKKLKVVTTATGRRPGDVVFITSGKVSGSDATVPLYLTPYATAGEDGKSQFAVWIARPGKGMRATLGSLFQGSRSATSRQGNQIGDIADGDPDSLLVTYDGKPANEDWFAVFRDAPAAINRVVFMHGRAFHDGGWFDSSAGKPRIQVQTERNGEWKTVAGLDAYPSTTSSNSAGLTDGQKFEVRFPRVNAVAVRVLGNPASGDSPSQAFSSCAELQAFLDP